jgi:hypoxanthine phosphoribosyltransferase
MVTILENLSIKTCQPIETFKRFLFTIRHPELVEGSVQLFAGSMKLGRVLLTQAQIRSRVKQLGKNLTRHYRGKRPLFLGVMNGALFFLNDLVRAVDLDDVEISTIRLTSYKGTKSTGILHGLEAVDDSVAGRHVLIVDDILDTGRTLSALVAALKKLGAADVKICVLLEKRGKLEVPIRADWIGFKIPDHFVVGYGLDYDGKYRALKQVRILNSFSE